MKITRAFLICILAAMFLLSGFGCSSEKSAPEPAPVATSVPEPTQAPAVEPTAAPTEAPTPEPTETPAPTAAGSGDALETHEG